jgi:hypothetical protein
MYPGAPSASPNWIAYAMTRGRVRLIARNNGARALLKLPPTFPTNSSIVDLVTSGNRLAGVTSDGGFVVWEVPPLVTTTSPRSYLCPYRPPRVTPTRASSGTHPTQTCSPSRRSHREAERDPPHQHQGPLRTLWERYYQSKYPS